LFRKLNAIYSENNKRPISVGEMQSWWFTLQQLCQDGTKYVEKFLNSENSIEKECKYSRYYKLSFRKRRGRMNFFKE
jgi:hypothetical protein